MDASAVHGHLGNIALPSTGIVMLARQCGRIRDKIVEMDSGIHDMHGTGKKASEEAAAIGNLKRIRSSGLVPGIR
jgi:hypothetical protein